MKFKLLFLSMCLFICSFSIYAKDVYVQGYCKKNGTCVQPYIRSSPDSSTANNYGPSRNQSELTNPRARDSDSDGTPNYLDRDDNNNGVLDDQDSNQYRQ